VKPDAPTTSKPPVAGVLCWHAPRRRVIFIERRKELFMDSPQPESWWSSNWRWFVPVGCFGMLTLAVLFVGLIMTLVIGLMKSSDIYRLAVAASSQHPAVIEVTGEPVKQGLLVTGNIHISNGSGDADIRFHLRGPEGGGTLHATGSRSDGKWTLESLIFIPDSDTQARYLLE
jgi:hypothetical protein